MKPAAIVIFLLTLIACNNETKTDPVLVKGSETNTNTAAAKKPGVAIPVVKYGVEGFYTGMFAAKYDENNGAVEIYNNKITICIDSLNETTLYGHSVVAGNDRPFSGSFEKAGNNYTAIVKEPGDNKYDGVFKFYLDTKNKIIKGTWKSNDKKLPVTEREYELESRQYKYDPSLDLSEDMIGAILHGSYNNKTDEGEAITEDALKKNASKIILKSKDVENMYKADLEVMRNAIYARHGYSFKTFECVLYLTATWSGTCRFLPMSANC